MLRKLGWLLRIVYNLLRMTVLRGVSLGKIKSSYICMISNKAKIRVSGNGCIIFGSRCMVDDNSLIRSSDAEVKIGNGVYINRNCNIVSRRKVEIKDGVSIGPNVCIYDHDHSFGLDSCENYTSESICIGKNTWIGANSVILKGSNIGDNVIIAAGSVVKGNIPTNTRVVQKRELQYKRIVSEEG